MARNWIVVGDPTSSGGSVITGSPFTDVDGTPVARVNDQATCPRHKGAYPIVDGDSTLIVDGQPVALHGSSLACGCKVLSAQQVRVFVDVGKDGGDRADYAPVEIISGAMARALQRQQPGPGDGAAPAGDARFDEALCLTDEAHCPLAGVHYVLHLDDGSQIEGTTDAEGRTVRVATAEPRRIEKVALIPQDVVCCAMHAACCPDALEPLEIHLDDVVTSADALGSSVRQVATPKGEARALTQGEIEMCRRVFADAIDYTKPRVHNREYLWFGLQPDNTAMAPNGNIYFNPKYFSEDFSDPGDPQNQWWFMHEMTHVWQHQLGYPVKWRGALRVGLGYEYVLAEDRKLSDYNMEAQGNILADYFALCVLRNPYAMRQADYRNRPDAPELYKKVLAEFLRDPSDRGNLP